MTKLAFIDPLRQFGPDLRFHEVVPLADFEAGFVHLNAEIERLALDAYTAQRRHTSFKEAAADFVNYPHLASVHAAIDDILTMSLPPTLVTWVKSLLAAPSLHRSMACGRLVAAAADPSHPWS